MNDYEYTQEQQMADFVQVILCSAGLVGCGIIIGLVLGMVIYG